MVRERKETLRNWTLGFLVFTAFGLLDFGYRYLDALSRNHPHEVGMRLLEQLTGAYTAGLLFPFVLWVTRRFSFLKLRWYQALRWHLGAMAVYGVVHTKLMEVSRDLLAPLFGLGSYDYGIMVWRYPMEASRQVTVYATWVVAITLYDHYRRARKNELAAAELQAKLAEAQLQNLRLQLHPHFLFNTLNTISSVMYEDVERADAMLTRLCDLLRRALRPADSQEVSLNEELMLLELYVDLMRARFGDDLTVAYDVDAGARDAFLPQLILQPLVENSIRHGGNPVTSRVDITISARRDNGHLLLEVSDRGPGLRETTTKGIGLSNTAGRLESLYGEAHSFVLDNRDGGGFRATLRVPFHTAAEA
jgi:two-component system LytT family sensor kinase